MACVVKRMSFFAQTVCLKSSTYIRCVSSAAHHKSFKFSDLQITEATGSQLKSKPDPANLEFGKQFSDHMFEVEWNQSSGWGVPKICPLNNLKLHPAAKVLHYGIELHEGLKVCCGEDKQIRIFRPDLHMKRMNKSITRAALPHFEEAEFVECMKRLIDVDRDWVPHLPGTSLFIRPTLIGTESSLGIGLSMTALLYILMCPVGSYFPVAEKPISLWADPANVRSSHGGYGSFMLGAVFAPTLYHQIEANEKHNCEQILWLYGPDQYIMEATSMNIFIHWINKDGEEELVTAPTTGTILPGVTRESILDLARSMNEFKVTERFVKMEELLESLQKGLVKEMFGTGTASGITPIGRIVYEHQELNILSVAEGSSLTLRLSRELTDIQFGRRESPWTVVI